MKRIYLDHAATTPTHPEVAQAMLPYLTPEAFGNPSSAHAFGRAAGQAVEEAREKIAALIGATSEEIFFTSGGTEADNWVIRGVAYANRHKGNHIITSAIEHHAVLNTCKLLEEEFRITYLPVDRYGLVDPDEVRRSITSETILISVMHANNEIGTIEPIPAIGKIARDAGVYFHTDAVQTVGHIPVDVTELGADLLSVSAHKLYGPKGIGALYVRKGTKISPLIVGGAQERGARAGTENVPGVVGFGKAAELAQKELPETMSRLTQLRDQLIQGLQERIRGTHLNGHPESRLPQNVNVSFEGVDGEAIALALDQAGISVSTGSACSTGAEEPYHDVIALGVSPELARGAVRLTLGRDTTRGEIMRVLEIMPPLVERLRTVSGACDASSAGFI